MSDTRSVEGLSGISPVTPPEGSRAWSVVCHYGEVALKGQNRGYFERKLRDNIRRALTRLSLPQIGSVRALNGRIILDLVISRDGWEGVAEALRNTFGLANFSFAERLDADIDEIKTAALSALAEESFDTFRITTRKADSGFPLSELRTNEIVGQHIVDSLRKHVNLKRPEANCVVEIVGREAFVYTRRQEGPGGIPVGSGGRVVAMISGGIDSPVASWFAMKRGARPLFVHFHSSPYTTRASVDKVQEIAALLCRYQPPTRLYLVPFAPVQAAIMELGDARHRVVLYRRMMVRIAEGVARRERAGALVTGDSLGQVASQTLENLAVVNAAATLPILRPLVGFDKREIVALAQKIGTFDTSILPDQDCCTLFVPRHPVTRARAERVQEMEKNLPMGDLVQSALLDSEIIPIA